jgi:hypothetical protein
MANMPIQSPGWGSVRPDQVTATMPPPGTVAGDSLIVIPFQVAVGEGVGVKVGPLMVTWFEVASNV